jgi:hypothetical protein
LLAGFGAAAIGGIATAANAFPRLSLLTLGADLQRGEMPVWSAMVGRIFRAPTATLRLVAVEPLCSAGPSPSAVTRSGRFAAVFEAVAGPGPDGDATYWLAPESAAPLPLYLGPRAVVSGRPRYVAVFS